MILNISWFMLILDTSEISLVELRIMSSLEPLMRWNSNTRHIFFINGLCCRLCKRFTKDVLRLHIRHITLVPWYVLSFHIVIRPTNPILSILRDVSKLKFLLLIIFGRWLGIESSLSIGILSCDCDIHIVV